MNNIIIELEVNNHPGVLSQVAGLFARRAFNLEGILCLSIGDKTKSIIKLLVNKDDRISQIVKQLEKLYDISGVKVKEDDQSFFNNLRETLIEQ
ncbi:MAG: ACT domain-containing protein [Desulfobacterales bacterium]|nr:ACT domain-containing protein [Desulfobacterales bacterium]MCP4159720.1 ACT domain-containing protein [Deltaproteobacteria bacterium]